MRRAWPGPAPEPRFLHLKTGLRTTRSSCLYQADEEGRPDAAGRSVRVDRGRVSRWGWGRRWGEKEPDGLALGTAAPGAKA